MTPAAMTPAALIRWLLASAGPLLNGYSLVVLGVALPLLETNLSLGPNWVSLLGSALMIGAAGGSLVGGLAADRFGRKPVFVVDMLILAVGAAIALFTREAPLLLGSQLLVGFAIGIDFPASSAYVAETMPDRLRNRMVVATIGLQSIGMLFGGLVAILVLDRGVVTDWKLLLGSAGALAVLAALGRLALPESPRWLAQHGSAGNKVADASAAGTRSGAAQRLGIQPSPSAAAGPRRGGLGLIFSLKYRARTALISVPWLLMDVATYGVGLFTPVILGSMHFGSSGLTGHVAADFADAKGTTVVDLFLLLGAVLSVWMVPRFGRVPMQVAGFGGMALGMLVLLFAASGNGPGVHSGLVVAGFVLFNLAMNAGPNATTFTLAPTLFPTSLRATASGFASACAKLGATFGTFFVPQLHASIGISGVLMLMAAVSVGGLIVTAALAHVVNEEGALDENEGGSAPAA